MTAAVEELTQFDHLTIPDFYDAATSAHPNRIFVREGDIHLTYREFREATLSAASFFRRRGISREHRVALLLGNSIRHLAVWFGLSRIGAISISMNVRLSAPELTAACAYVRPVLVVAEGRHLDLAGRLGLPSVDAVAPLQTAGEELPCSLAGGDIAAFILTSGSTGTPKAVMQTHRTYVLTGQAFPWWVGLSGDDRVMTVLPLHHINAQAYSVMGAIGAGASLVLVPRFSASDFWNDVRAGDVTEFNVVGAMLRILLGQPESADDASSPARTCYSALALPEEEHRRFEDRFGLQLIAGYGLSESTFGTIWPRVGLRPYGSMGYLRQHPTLGLINEAIVVDDNGKPLDAGGVGELWLRNPATMAGYFDDEQATNEGLHDGWLHTGDLVSCSEDGLYRFVARKKEIIRRRGENIAPAEIETVLLAHPDVYETAVVGVPSSLGEDDLRAYVVLRTGAAISADALRQWCSGRLASFKIPHEVVFRAELPHTETQRVARHRLA